MDIYKIYHKDPEDRELYIPLIVWPVYSTKWHPFFAEDVTAERPGGELAYTYVVKKFETSPFIRDRVAPLRIPRHIRT